MNKNSINKICRKFGFELHGTGYLQSVRKSIFREDAFEIQSELLAGKAEIIFDVGANFGDTVLKYNELFPKATVYAFEPFPSTFAGMLPKVNHLKNVNPFQVAVSDKEGKAIFYVNQNVDTNSLLPSQKIGLSSDQQVQQKAEIDVNLITIDSFCRQQGIKKIDILKLDIQGGELAALQGASGLLKQKAVKLIYAESYFKAQYVKQPLFYDIAKYLEQFDYSLQDMYNPIYGKGSIAWCDVIFLPNNQ